MRFGKYQAAILIELLLILILVSGLFLDREQSETVSGTVLNGWQNTAGEGQDYIKWVDFTVPCEALDFAYEQDVKAYEAGTRLDWVCLLAHTAAKWGGQFDSRAMEEMKKTAAAALEGADEARTATDVIDEAGEDLKYYPYYKEAYGAVLSGMVGEYERQQEQEDGTVVWEKVYGLKAYSPIAKGFDYSDYDDFGAARSYGYSRPHLGHDMMGQVGTPIKIKKRTCASENDAQVFAV